MEIERLFVDTWGWLVLGTGRKPSSRMTTKLVRSVGDMRRLSR
jgi:hypothetical protein